jgi:high-affinity Fe2+/Pb2+ permease
VSASAGDEGSSRDQPETEETRSRLDRELNELLQELRVLLVAVTVVFGFLLGVPFTQVFSRSAGDSEEVVYYVALVANAVAIVMLVTPGVWHRLRWRSHDKEMLLRAGNRFTILGTVFAAVALGAVVLLVTEVLFGWGAAIATSTAIAVLVLVVWFAVPLSRGADDPD